MRTHIALTQDPDKYHGFDTVGDYQYNTTCSGVKDGVRYWFEFPVTLDPIIVNGKILVPKDQIVMSEVLTSPVDAIKDNFIARLIHNKMWNDYVLIETAELGTKFKEGEGRVIRGRWKGRKVLFVGGVGIDFQSSVKYTKQDNVLWIE